ncbi:hypothetical protein V1277_004746 [Bradyrhizobium sp. AZCC 1588]
MSRSRQAIRRPISPSPARNQVDQARPFPLRRMPNSCMDGRVAQRLKRSSRRAAPPAFQNGIRVRPSLDRQRNGQAAALFANRLECLPVLQGDARLNIHTKSINQGLRQTGNNERSKMHKSSSGPGRHSDPTNSESCRSVQRTNAFNPNGREAFTTNSAPAASSASGCAQRPWPLASRGFSTAASCLARGFAAKTSQPGKKLEK